MKARIHKYKNATFIDIGDKSNFFVSLNNFGASIYSIYFDNQIMTLTAKCPKKFSLSNIYFGKCIGPIANRIKDGELSVSDIKVKLEPNEGSNVLHSGKYGISNKGFDYRIIDEGNKVRVIFSQSDENLPPLQGFLEYKIEYIIDEDNKNITLNQRVNVTSSSILNLTNHAYFCLGEKNLNNLRLRIPSKRYIHPNVNDLTYEDIRDIPKCLDFNKTKPIMKDIDNEYLQNSRTKGYDHCFLLEGNTVNLFNKKYQLDIITDYDAVQIYSDNYHDVYVVNSNEKIHRAVAIEPMMNPLNLKVIKPNDIYQKQIIYKFKKVS